MKEISSVSNPYIKELLKLQNKKDRDINQKFIVEGYHLVEEALKANVLIDVLSVSDHIEGAFNYKVTSEIIKKLSSTMNPQNIIGVCKIEENICFKGNKFLLLDSVNDPGNLGTIIRTALAFNIDNVILSEDCVDLYNDKVIRGTQGALFHINIFKYNLKEAIQKLKENGITVYGTSLYNSIDIKEIKKEKQYAIILGNEANGIKKEILNITDKNIRIDINKQMESLNVAIAGGIVLYEFHK